MNRSPEGSFVQIVMADPEYVCTFQPIQYTHSPNSNPIVTEGVMMFNIL